MLLQLILEHHLPNGHAHCSGNRSRERKGRGGGCNVLWRNPGLQCNQRRLKVWTDPECSDYFEDDNSRPADVSWETDKQSEAQCREEETKNYDFQVATRLPDEDASADREDAQCEAEG